MKGENKRRRLSRRKGNEGGKERRGDEVCTVDPADGERLEDGEQQQAGSAAGVMVVDLEHVQTPLDTDMHTRERTLHYSNHVCQVFWFSTSSVVKTCSGKISQCGSAPEQAHIRGKRCD